MRAGWTLALLAVVALVFAARAVALDRVPPPPPPHELQAPVYTVDGATGVIRERATGRSVLLHGLNVVVKIDPFIPQLTGFSGNSFSSADAELLQALGFNAIRLGVMWSGVEPCPGEYNHTYLAAARQIADTAAAAGIVTLVEFHQDLLSERFCADGVPLWALDPKNSANFPVPLADAPYPVDNSTGSPDWTYCGKLDWFSYYFSESVSKEFGRLYAQNGTGPFGAQFTSYWQQVAAAFATSDSVIGYELVNEPWCGDIYADPELLLPGVADAKTLQPLYDTVAAAIRAIDNRHIVFFEPVTWDDVGVGFTDVPGGRDRYANASVLSYHYYAPPQLGTPADCMALRAKDNARLGTVSVLTEFWVEDQGPASYEPMRRTVEAADAYGQSWIGWSYKGFMDSTDFGHSVLFANGTQNPTIVAIVSRAYAQATAGVVLSGVFNATTAVYTLTYRVDRAVAFGSEQTDIYINQALHYPNGFMLAVDPPNAVAYANPSTNRVTLSNQPTTKDGTVVTVQILPSF